MSFLTGNTCLTRNTYLRDTLFTFVWPARLSHLYAKRLALVSDALMAVAISSLQCNQFDMFGTIIC